MSTCWEHFEKSRVWVKSKKSKWPYLQFPPIQNLILEKVQNSIQIPHFYPLWGAYYIRALENFWRFIQYLSGQSSMLLTVHPNGLDSQE